MQRTSLYHSGTARGSGQGNVGSDGVLSAVVGDDGPLANQLRVRQVSLHVNDHETSKGSKKKWSRRRWSRGLSTLELCLDGPSSKHAHWHTARPAGHIASAPVHRFPQLLPCTIPFYYNSARSSSCSFWVRSFVRRLLFPHPFLRVVRSASAGPLFFLPSFLSFSRALAAPLPACAGPCFFIFAISAPYYSPAPAADCADRPVESGA
ncbi:hypothetical protein EDB89DRAFT_473701 [Lactarius sanguifluus]|nr:hypothetical protein EDB89DRAFT_473701 [Lactarius sanguifluus]